MMLAGVVGGAAHRGHARAELRRGRLQQRPVDRDLDVVGHEPLEDLLGLGLVLDERVLAGLVAVVASSSASSRRPRGSSPAAAAAASRARTSCEIGEM